MNRSLTEQAQATVQGKFSPLLIALMAFFGLVAWSPLVGAPGRGALIFVAVLASLVMLIIVCDRSISLISTLMIAAILTSAGVAALYWSAFAPYTGVIWVILALLFWSVSTERERGVFVDLASIWIICLLIGAFLAFALLQFGVGPVGSFINPDGRSNFVFWGTFSNTHFGRFMRPSGVYDEPGAFSFLICAIVAMRYFLGKRADVSLLMLVFGLITFSLAHVVFLVAYLFALSASIRNWLSLLVLGSLFTLILSQVGALNELQGLGERAELVDIRNIRLGEQVVAGDNRSGYLAVSIAIMNKQDYSFLYGYDVSCVTSFDCGGLVEPNCCQPLLLLSFRGIVQSWFYYACLVVLLASPVFMGRGGMVGFGFGLILLQRPSAFELGYAMLVVMVVALAMTKGYGFRARHMQDAGWIRFETFKVRS